LTDAGSLVWVAAFIPGVAGVGSLIRDPLGGFRSSGLMAGVAVTLGAIAVVLRVPASNGRNTTISRPGFATLGRPHVVTGQILEMPIPDGW
jgi:hypothetical protein